MIFNQIKAHAGIADWLCTLECQEADPNSMVSSQAFIKGAPTSPSGTFRALKEGSALITYNPGQLNNPMSLVRERTEVDIDQGTSDLMKHAPPGYECPFCGIAKTLPSPAPESAIVLVDANVFALVPTHHYAGIKGNCLVIPRGHYENVLDIPDDLGSDFFRATRRLAGAMRHVFQCEGISTRQHNGPAGDQDVWHFHLHVFPRYSNDGLYAGQKVLYTIEERMELAARLRVALR